MGGSESKISLSTLLSKLQTEEIPPNDPQFWQALFSFKITFFDLAISLTYADINKINDAQPANIFSLIEKSLIIIDATARLNESPSTIMLNETSLAIKLLAKLVPLCNHKYPEFWWGEDKKGALLLNSIFALSFTPGYAVSKKQQKDPTNQAVLPNLLWYRGANKNDPKMSSNTKTNQRRLDLLYLLIACLSDPIFKNILDEQARFSPWQWTFCSSNAHNSKQFFINLLNCVYAYDSVGKWNIPYSGYFYSEEEQSITKCALYILTLIVSFKPPEEQIVQNSPILSQLSGLAPINEFMRFFDEINEEELYSFCVGLLKKLEVLAIVVSLRRLKRRRPCRSRQLSLSRRNVSH